MTTDPILASPVDWSGDNPGIYLKEGADDPFRSLMVWFRVAVSAHGAGHALVLLEDPTRAASWPHLANFCMSDNLPLARDLVARFVTRFGVFRDVPALPALRFLELEGHDVSGDGVHSSSIVARGVGIEVELVWNALGTPFCADVPPAISATGEHRMLSVFVEAAEAAIIVNGTRLPGRPFPRPFLGRTMSSAFLASSETWLRA